MQFWGFSGFVPWGLSYGIFCSSRWNSSMMGPLAFCMDWNKGHIWASRGVTLFDCLSRNVLVLQLLSCPAHCLLLHGQHSSLIQQGVPPLVADLLRTFGDVFTEPTALPPWRVQDHSITLQPGVQLVFVLPYHYPFYQKAEIEKIVKELLHTGIIRPSHNPFSSPVLLVRKADDTWRMCMDYRALNKLTIKDKFHIPVVDELLDELWGSIFFF